MRTSRILDLLGTPDAMSVLLRLLEADCSQTELLAELGKDPSGEAPSQAAMSSLMTRSMDLGLVRRDRPRSKYSLVAPEETQKLVAALGDLVVELRRHEQLELSRLPAERRLSAVGDKPDSGSRRETS